MTSLLLALLYTAIAVTLNEPAKCGPISRSDALLVIDVQNDFMEADKIGSRTPFYSIPPDAIPKGDFVKKGSLAVSDTSAIVPIINEWVNAFESNGGLVAYSLDWHSPNHCSFCRNGTAAANPQGHKPTGDICPFIGKDSAGFDSTGMCEDDRSIAAYRSNQLFQWPDHCVHDQFGSRFSPFLRVSPDALVVKKGFLPSHDSYSAWRGVLSAEPFPFWNRVTPVDVHKQQPTLGRILEDRAIKRVFVVGIASDYCVKMSCLDAVSAGITTVFVGAACRGVTPQSTAAAIDEMAAAGVVVLPPNVRDVDEALAQTCELARSTSAQPLKERIDPSPSQPAPVDLRLAAIVCVACVGALLVYGKLMASKASRSRHRRAD